MPAESFGDRAPYRRLVLLFALIGAGVAFRFHILQHNGQVPAYDKQHNSVFYWTESAIQYRYARMAADGQTIPVLDTRAQYPEGIRTPNDLTILMERIHGRLYRWLGRPAGFKLDGFLNLSTALFYALSALAVFMVAWSVFGDADAATWSVAFYTLAPGSYNRMIAAYEYEYFSAPLIFLSIACLLACNDARLAFRARRAAVLVTFASTFLALGAWHFSRFVLLVVAGIALLCRLLFRDRPFPAREAVWAMTAGMILAGLVFPTLRYRFFLGSPAAVVMYVLALTTLSADGTFRFSDLRRPSVVVGLCLSGVLLAVYLGWFTQEDTHVHALFVEKLKHLLRLPRNPAALDYDARIMWIGPINSPTAYSAIYEVFILALFGGLPLASAISSTARGRSSFGQVFLALNALAWMFLYLMVVRLSIFVAFFLSVYVAGCHQALAGREGRLRAAVMLLWLGLSAQVAEALAFTRKTTIVGRPFSRLADSTKERSLFSVESIPELLDWIRGNTNADDALLAPYPLSASILAYVDRPVVLQPKFESSELRDKYKRFLDALFGDEAGFHEFCRRNGAVYFIHDMRSALTLGPGSDRYQAGKECVRQDSMAALAHFYPRQLRRFALVYQNRSYRVYRVLDGDVRTPSTLPYSPIYDPVVFGAGQAPVAACLEPEKVAAGKERIIEVEELMGLGVGKARNADWPGAGSYFARAASLGVSMPQLDYYFASTLWRLGKQEEAVRHYERALRLDPGHPQARMELLQLLIDAKSYAAAERFAKEGLKFTPDDDRLYMTLAQAYWGLRRRADYEHARSQALRLNPANARFFPAPK